jgi:fatty acid synthase subunit alpha
MVKDEPVKDLLGNINKALLIQRLLERKYGGDKFAVPTIDYLSVQSKAVPKTLSSVTRTEVGNFVTFKFGSELPETESWLQTLAGSELNWLSALISSPTVVQGTSYVDNALRRILVPRAGQKVVVKYAGSLPLSVTVYGAARSYDEHESTFKALSIIFNSETKLIDLTLFEERQDVAVPLTLQFQHCHSQGFAPIHEIASARNKRIKQFYWRLWFGDNEVLPNIDIHENFVGPDAAINSGDVEQFCAVTGN